MASESDAASAALIWSPFADLASARAVAEAMLTRKLVACANIQAGIESLFLYEGKVDSAREVGVLFKTSAARLGEAIEALASFHPYDTPAIVGWVADASAPSTITWLEESLAATESAPG